jgi:hypothetical protein
MRRDIGIYLIDISNNCIFNNGFRDLLKALHHSETMMDLHAAGHAYIITVVDIFEAVISSNVTFSASISQKTRLETRSHSQLRALF